MSIYLKFALFQCAMIIPFISGIAARGYVKSPQALSRRLLRTNLIGLEPLIVLWCTWGLTVSASLMILPICGFGLIVLGVLAGSLAAGMLRLSGKRRQTFLITSSLANHGFTMGGFLCYFFFGEAGLGSSVILVLYFIPYVYCLVFPYARTSTGQKISFGGFFKKTVHDIQNMPLFAMAAGLLLNATGIKRPDIAFPLDALLLVSIALYYLTLGISFTRVNVRSIRRELTALSVIKFIIVPGAACAMLSVLPLDPALKAVIQLQAFMPAAIYSMVTAVLFDLDTDLASGLFVCNTVVFLTMVLPAIFVFKEALFAM
jgi:malate permease and related proteins